MQRVVKAVRLRITYRLRPVQAMRVTLECTHQITLAVHEYHGGVPKRVHCPWCVVEACEHN